MVCLICGKFVVQVYCFFCLCCCVDVDLVYWLCGDYCIFGELLDDFDVVFGGVVKDCEIEE